MADYEINKTSAQAMASFLRQLLRENVPEGDFTEGGVASDIVIDGMAVITTWLGNQVAAARARQSLLTLKELPESESVADSADAILDNYFLRRDQGRFARGAVTLHFSQRVDSRINRAIRFFKNSSKVFYVDSAADLFISADNLKANLDASGRVTDYTATVYLTAARVGADYNLSAGRFQAVDRFSPFLVYVENLVPMAGGADVQSTSAFINGAEDALSLRALVNARSNRAVLKSAFAAIEDVLTVGYGDPEMGRDLLNGVSNVSAIHLGGCVDLYTRTPMQDASETGTLNELVSRNDGKILYFRDSAPPSGSFITHGVSVGDVLVIENGLPESPASFVIASVSADTLGIAPNTPFSVATELLPSTPLDYTIGNDYPVFANKYSAAAVATAVTSDKFKEFNAVVLDSAPATKISRVELILPPPSMSTYVDPSTGTVVFSRQLNSPPLTPPAAGSAPGFYVENRTPSLAGSGSEVVVVYVGWPAVDLTGYQVEVTYETPSELQAVADFCADPLQKPSANSLLVRGFHGVYVAMTIPYRLRTTTTNGVLESFDEVAAAAALSEFVNAYTSYEPLDISLLATKARDLYPGIAAVFPPQVSYELMTPTGQMARFTTVDLLTVFPTTNDGALFTNASDFGMPATGYEAAWKNWLLARGVSDRTTRYLTKPDLITFERRV